MEKLISSINIDIVDPDRETNLRIVVYCRTRDDASRLTQGINEAARENIATLHSNDLSYNDRCDAICNTDNKGKDEFIIERWNDGCECVWLGTSEIGDGIRIPLTRSKDGNRAMSYVSLLRLD